MKNKEFLPIGSVVLLNGGTKKVMITGFCSIPNDNNHKIYDYSGCLYPEGILNSNEVCLFNDEQISEIFYKGYESDEEKSFKEQLKNTVNSLMIDDDHNIVSSNLSDENSQEPFNINNSVFE